MHDLILFSPNSERVVGNSEVIQFDRLVGIALLSEAAALWFDAEVIIHGP